MPDFDIALVIEVDENMSSNSLLITGENDAKSYYDGGKFLKHEHIFCSFEL